MIIKRSYVTLKKLYMTDPFSKEVLEAAFADAGGTASDVWKKNTRTRLFNATMGCCIPNFGMICDAFKKLDEEHPYDNGLTAKDVDHGDVFAWRDDGTVVLALCDKKGNMGIGFNQPTTRYSEKTGSREIFWTGRGVE